MQPKSTIMLSVIARLKQLNVDDSQLEAVARVENPSLFDWDSRGGATSRSFVDHLTELHPSVLVPLASSARRNSHELEGVAEAIEQGIFDACRQLPCDNGPDELFCIADVVDKLFVYFSTFNLSSQQRSFKLDLYKQNPQLYEKLHSTSEAFAQASTWLLQNGTVMKILRESVLDHSKSWRPRLRNLLDQPYLASFFKAKED